MSLMHTGWTTQIATQTSETLSDYLLATHNITLSKRKLKWLKDHRWVSASWMTIPWGFFRPRISQDQIVFEDDHLMAVAKPPFIPVVSSTNHTSLLHLWKQLRPSLYAVHRLDFETSGAVLFAKSKAAHETLTNLFRKRLITKTYWAWVHGKPKHTYWTCKKPILVQKGRVIGHPDLGKAAQTAFQLMDHLQDAEGRHLSLIKAKPATGRMHQVRFHLFDVGHQVVGETLYGGPSVMRKYGVRMLLHASHLRFSGFNRTYDIQCQLPSDFKTSMTGNAKMPSEIPTLRGQP